MVQQQALELVDRRSPYGNGSLRPRRVFGFGGATQSGAKEVPRSECRRVSVAPSKLTLAMVT